MGIYTTVGGLKAVVVTDTFGRPWREGQTDIAIGVDTTLACDTPGVPEQDRTTEQGKGFGLHIRDGAFIADRGLVDTFANLAEAESLAAANKRIQNIIRKFEGTPPDKIDRGLLQEPAEVELAEAAEARYGFT